jgi:hypothetical protein
LKSRRKEGFPIASLNPFGPHVKNKKMLETGMRGAFRSPPFPLRLTCKFRKCWRKEKVAFGMTRAVRDDVENGLE